MASVYKSIPKPINFTKGKVKALEVNIRARGKFQLMMAFPCGVSCVVILMVSDACWLIL